MKKTIGIVAHVDAGKTTFSEQLLFHTNRIKELGRVDRQTSFLDNNEIEKDRGITISFGQANFSYNESTYYLLDTPGHVDFAPEMERTIQVLDYAIIIVCAVEGVQGYTETVWQLLRKHNIPTFFFINKTDRTGANVEKVLEEINVHLTEDTVLLNDSLQTGNMEIDLIETIAEKDDDLLERYFNDEFDYSLWMTSLINNIKHGAIYPCMVGSALQDIGIVTCLENIDLLTETKYNDKDEFSGRVFKVRYNEQGTRMTFMKSLSGKLAIRDDVHFIKSGQKKVGKITGIHFVNGNDYTQVNEVVAGDIFAVTGLTEVADGDGVGTLIDHMSYELIPTLRARVIVDEQENKRDVLSIFNMLNEEDSSLQVNWDEHTEQIIIHVMGTIQLEVLQHVMKERFNKTVSFGDPEIVYKETIDNSVIGYGHFEPYRHFAEVHLKIEQGERNSGIQFTSEAHTNEFPMNYQNLVKQHIFERHHHGLLTGSTLTDVKITLLRGQAHHEYTSGGDFREATFRALRQGLEKAENVLLEPFYSFTIKVEADLIGRVMSDVERANGIFDPPQTIGDQMILTGRAPVATFMNYSSELLSFTKGKGMINLKFAGYYRCHNAEEVINAIGYDKDKDPQYTSSSIFCAKGDVFSIPWDEAEKWMSLL